MNPMLRAPRRRPETARAAGQVNRPFDSAPAVPVECVSAGPHGPSASNHILEDSITDAHRHPPPDCGDPCRAFHQRPRRRPRRTRPRPPARQRRDRQGGGWRCVHRPQRQRRCRRHRTRALRPHLSRHAGHRRRLRAAFPQRPGQGRQPDPQQRQPPGPVRPRQRRRSDHHRRRRVRHRFHRRAGRPQGRLRAQHQPAPGL